MFDWSNNFSSGKIKKWPIFLWLMSKKYMSVSILTDIRDSNITDEVTPQMTKTMTEKMMKSKMMKKKKNVLRPQRVIIRQYIIFSTSLICMITKKVQGKQPHHCYCTSVWSRTSVTLPWWEGSEYSSAWLHDHSDDDPKITNVWKFIYNWWGQMHIITYCYITLFKRWWVFSVNFSTYFYS